MGNMLWRITLDTNPEDCNLNCLMCEENSEYSAFKENLYKSTGKKHRRMPLSWIEPIIQQAAEMGVREIIPTTMGDPLVSPHFERIVASAKENGLKLNVTHNGTFPGKGAKEWAEIITPVTSDIKISWNGATRETAESIMKGIDYTQAMKNLKTLLKERDKTKAKTGHYCSISLQLTFMTINLAEIPEIIRLAGTMGVDRVKGHHLWTHFEEIEQLAMTNSQTKINDWNRCLEAIKDVITDLESQNIKAPSLEGFFPICPDSEEKVPTSYDCPFLGKELWISATGQYAPCCAPDEQRKTLGSFGQFPETTLSEVMQSSAYLWLQQHYKEIDLCQHCKMRKPQHNETN